MTADFARLDKLLQKPGSEKKVLAFFRGMPESERQSYSKHCAAWYRKHLKAQRDNIRGGTQAGSISLNSEQLLPIAVVAAYCCCPFDVVRTGGWLTQIDIDLVCDAVADRRPKWASQWMAHAVRSAWSGDWPRLRALMQEGLCDKPDEDHYVRLMIDGVSLGVKSVARRLEKDPDLFEDDFWKIFQIPGVMRNESMCGYLDDAWLAGILQLEKKGRLDRSRLFEAILSTPHMGFNQSQIKFFLTLHDGLRPTAMEREQRVPDYAALVDSPLAPVSKWSYELLREIDSAAHLPLAAVAEPLKSSLRGSTKARVRESLRWLQDLLQRDNSAADVCRIAATGLLHEKADLQAEVWKFLKKHAPPAETLLAELRELQPHVAASTRRAMAEWLESQAAASGQIPDNTPADTTIQATGSDITPLAALAAEAKKRPQVWRSLCAIDELLAAGQSTPLQIPPTRFCGTELRRLEAAEPLAPITSLDELLEVAAAVLEVPDRYEDGERVIDALTRIAPDPAHTACGPLRKRLQQLARRFAGLPFTGHRNHVDLVPMLQCWGEFATLAEIRKEVRGKYALRPKGLLGFLSLRNKAVFERLAGGQPVALLGTMTHRGGWIAAEQLVARLKAVSDDSALLESDLVLSLLRLAPDDRRAALTTLNRAKKLTSEYAQALRYALGGKATVGDSAPLWVAAARSRHPYDDDEAVELKFPDLGPDAGRVARYRFRTTDREPDAYADDSPRIEGFTYRYPQDPRFDFPTVIPHQFLMSKSAAEGLDTKPEPRECTNAAATVWPLNRDSFYASRSAPADDLDPLFDPCTPMRAPQSFALAQSLVSGYVVYAPEVAAATDLAITTIQDGRYDAAAVGEYLAMQLESVQRFAKALKAIAEASPLHMFQTVRTILAIFEHPLPGKIPARISDLFSLLNELLQELEMPLPAHSVTPLTPFAKGAGKSAKLVKQILAFSPDGVFDSDAILALAVEGRLTAPRSLA